MSLRPDPTDPADMTPERRLDEVASICAYGILRLHGRCSHVPSAEYPDLGRWRRAGAWRGNRRKQHRSTSPRQEHSERAHLHGSTR